MLKSLIPKSGWLLDYLTYTRSVPTELTEVPLMFNLFIGLTAISASLRRNVFVDRGTFKIYPAMMVILIAPTGKGKKTTAINYGRALIEKAQVTRILSETITPEALIEALSTERAMLKGDHIVKSESDAVGMAIIPELSVFLEKRDYKSGLVPLLTRLGDSPESYSSETIGRGQRPLQNVALSLMAGSAKSWLTGSIPIDAFLGGFMARFIFVVSDGAKNPVPKPPGLDKSLQARLVEELRKFSKIEGEVTIEPDAEDFFQTWYNGFFHARSFDEKQAAYEERKQDHVLRIAMILAISQYRDVINLADMKTSLELFGLLERTMYSLFGEIERGQTPMGENISYILGVIKRKGIIGRSELLRKVVAKGVTAAMVSEAIDSLKLGGFVKETRESNPVASGRAGIVYHYQREEKADG